MMDQFLYGAVVSLVSSLLGAVIGGAMSWKGAVAAVRWQWQQQATAMRGAYLQNLHDELEQNRTVLSESLFWVQDAPVEIENLMAPAGVHAAHLRTEAWDALVRAGVLQSLPNHDAQVLRLATLAVRDAQ
ncbi:MAG: DUF3572 family protein, partial [bacterium]